MCHINFGQIPCFYQPSSVEEIWGATAVDPRGVKFSVIKEEFGMGKMGKVKRTLMGQLIFFLIAVFLCSSEANADQWIKTSGGTGIDIASCIQQTSDGGYIVASVTDGGRP